MKTADTMMLVYYVVLSGVPVFTLLAPGQEELAR
jgi:hypothetical protein